MVDKIQQMVGDICFHSPKLEDPRYKIIVKNVSSCLIDNKVGLTILKDCNRSHVKWDIANIAEIHPVPIVIFLGIKDYPSESIYSLWDLIHELSHLLIFDFGNIFSSRNTDPCPVPWWLKEDRCARDHEEAQLRLDNEEATWWKAKERLKQFDLKEAEWDDFAFHRNACLFTYVAEVAHFP